MEKYYDNVTVIIDYLEMNKYCSTTIQANQRCFRKFEKFLSNKGVDYSPEIADEWYASEISSISKTDRKSTRIALERLQDVYETGRIRLNMKQNIFCHILFYREA